MPILYEGKILDEPATGGPTSKAGMETQSAVCLSSLFEVMIAAPVTRQVQYAIITCQSGKWCSYRVSCIGSTRLCEGLTMLCLDLKPLTINLVAAIFRQVTAQISPFNVQSIPECCQLNLHPYELSVWRLKHTIVFVWLAPCKLMLLLLLSWLHHNS